MRKYRLAALLASIVLAMSFMSCGKSNRTPGVDPNGFGGIFGGNDPGITTGPSPTPTDLIPTFEEAIWVTGSGGVSPVAEIDQFNADKLLKVEVTAGEASQNTYAMSDGSYTLPYTAGYGCINYQVKLLVQQADSTGALQWYTLDTRTTGALHTTTQMYFNLCPTAPPSATLDFSGRLSSNHGPLKLEITATGTDYMCQYLKYWHSMGYLWDISEVGSCPMKPVLQQHTVTGNVSIQTDGTQPVN